MQEKIVVGIIGCGMVAERHISSLLKIKYVRIKWLCDISNNVLKNALERFDILYGSNNYKDVLKDKEVNAIIICTPPNSHFQIASDAIDAEKNILLEKPLAISMEQINKLYDKAISKLNLTVIDCSVRHSRLQPKFHYIKQMIESGKLGHVYCIHHNAVYRQNRPGIEYHPEAKWFFNKEVSGGGPLVDWGVYDLSFHLGILNDIPEKYSMHSFTINGLDSNTYNNKYFNVEEHGIVLMKFENDFIYYWERATNAHNDAPNETRIYGTKGGLKLSYLPWEKNEVIYYYTDQDGKLKKDLLYIDMSQHFDDFYALDEHFVNCILGNEKPILPIKLSVKHLSMIFESII